MTGKRQERVQALIERLVERPLGKRAPTWHPIPFEGFGELPFQVREDFIRGRLDQVLAAHSDPRELHVVDLGCNVGFYAFSLAKLGARVTAIDRNADVIDVARELADIYELPVDFRCEEVTPATLPESADIVLCFSMLQWVVSDQGQDAADALLAEIARRSPSLFFDVPVNKGFNFLRCEPGGELAFVRALLESTTDYPSVEHVDTLHPYDDHDRHLFHCRR